MSRFAWFLCMVCLAAPAAAQEPGPAIADVPIPYAAQAPALVPAVAPAPKRPSMMLPLYGGFAALQGADYLSTRRALASGMGREANPLMAPFAAHPAAFLTLKAASAAGVIWAGEKLWRKNRVGAVVFMLAANGAMSAVVAHNYSVARR